MSHCKAGDTLENGATVLDYKATAGRTPIVLAKQDRYRGPRLETEYVTWRVEDGHTHLGHYHGADLKAALADFASR